MGIYRRDRKRKYRTALRKLIAKEPIPASKALPLTHVTESIHLEAILDDGQLTPQPCEVFGEKLLYAFYARPAYRGNKEGPLHNVTFAPVCFIIDASATKQCVPVEVFPFDTGALKRGVMAEDVHSDLSPFDFSLEPKVESAQRLVKIFFGNEKCYFLGGHQRPPAPDHSPTDADIVAYESLVRRSGNMMRDERVTSVEFQFKYPLLIDGKVLAVILPQEFLDVPKIREAIRKKKISPLPYAFIPNHSVKEFVGVFYTLANGLYARKKKQCGWSW